MPKMKNLKGSRRPTSQQIYSPTLKPKENNLYICNLRVIAVRAIEDDEFPGCNRCFEEHHPHLGLLGKTGYVDTDECRGDHAEFVDERAHDAYNEVQRHSVGGQKRKKDRDVV